MKEIQEIQAWQSAAADAGDHEGFLIASRALGETIDYHMMTGTVPRARVARIARMTPRGAARIVASWGPASDEWSEDSR